MRKIVGIPTVRKIIGISGKLCSGKDTIAKYLIARYGGQRLAFADKLKVEAARLVKEVTGEDIDPFAKKTPEIRSLLQQLGTAGRMYRDDFWVQYVLAQAVDRDKYYYITDVRYPNESQAIYKLGGYVVHATCLEVIRQQRIAQWYPGTTMDQQNHVSEIALDLSSFRGWPICTDTPGIMASDLRWFMYHMFRESL